ncbi:MAG: phenylalanine--tRNA ligase subunit alpha [Gammaproteobacteria bacterium]|jgi:phenylalanyl-tRNA synthetase alpha chain|nr:phenylalanine--tRNA ligase subunit alpha [Gammaproteobacteria bacterium]MBL6898854.1 phenylalanine--tRNA ligase subunit alpha [Gammaproteobacteria bacterium]
MDIHHTDLENSLKEDLQNCNNEHDLLQIKSKYLGKKGLLTSLFASIKNLGINERKRFGIELNNVKNILSKLLASKLESLKAADNTTNKIDLDVPPRHHNNGSHHPISLVIRKIENIFLKYGFDIQDGPEIETEHYNFESLNILENHPARDMHDTFYLNNKLLLRTHTSSVQIHAMENSTAPFRVLAPGRVYRCDSDPTHSPMFHQIEGLCVDTDITFSNLKWILNNFIREFFESKSIKTRFRPSYFPFTEPSAEMDIMFNNKWLEVLGCGMVHPNVLKNVNIDPKKYSGFAFGLGIERFAMLAYQIKDLRVFFENDINFLEQFKHIR